MSFKVEKIYITSLFLTLLCNYSISYTDDLKSPENQADYLIISTNYFLENLDLLITLRESQGLTIKTVNIDTLYSQFQDTLSKQDAIKQFISYTLEYWSNPKPEYLLLVGDVEYVPSYKVLSEFHDSIYEEDSISIDNQFAINLYDGDSYPDIAIGRLPVSDSHQLQNIIAKIWHFENFISRNSYGFDFLGLADFRNSEYIFEYEVRDIIDKILPEYYSFQRIDRRIESTYHGIKTDIINNINNNPLFVSFFGHANSYIWADTSFFYIDDINNIVSNNLPFIFTSMTSSQSFDITDTMTIVEKLICKENGGTIFSFAPVGLMYTIIGDELIKKFYSKIFENPNLTIGKVIQGIRAESTTGLQSDYLLLRFTLLGDPALKLPPDIIADILKPEYESLSKFELYQNYPNPFNSTTIIKVNIPQTGFITINAFDINGEKVDIIQEGFLNQGVHSITWNPTHLASGMYFIRMNADQINQTIRALYLK